MNKKQKTTLFIVIGLLIIAAVIAMAILLLPGQKKHLKIERVNDNPMIAYEKVERQKEKGTTNLFLCQIGAEPQKIVSDARFNRVGANGDMLWYTFEGSESVTYDLYLMNSAGYNQLCAKDTKFIFQSEDGYAVGNRFSGQIDKLYIRKYTPEGQLINEAMIDMGQKYYGWELNSDASLILFKINWRSQQEDAIEGETDPYEFNWGDIYLYQNGEMEIVDEQGFLSADGQSITNDGTILYMADGYEKTKTGTLYIRELGKEPKALVGGATQRFAISNNGNLIAAIIKDVEQKNLFYKFKESEAITVGNFVQFLISEDGSTLYYTVESGSDMQYDLYSVKEGKEPIKISENVTLLIESSDDGKSVSYMSNFDDKLRGDLFIARQGEETELIDTEVNVTGLTGLLGFITVNMYEDGSAIAYIKNLDGILGDLYVKQKGNQPQKIDENVCADFDFFK